MTVTAGCVLRWGVLMADIQQITRWAQAGLRRYGLDMVVIQTPDGAVGVVTPEGGPFDVAVHQASNPNTLILERRHRSNRPRLWTPS